MSIRELASRFGEAEKYFTKELYSKTVVEAREAFMIHDYNNVESLLRSLPNQQQLLEQLLAKLENKSVYKTLKKVLEGKTTGKDTALKALFSLGTHVAIECEQGNPEFGVLLPFLFEKIGQLVFGE